MFVNVQCLHRDQQCSIVMYICTVPTLKSTAGEFKCTVSFAEQNVGVMVCTVGVPESTVLILDPAVDIICRIKHISNCTACGSKCTVDL